MSVTASLAIAVSGLQANALRAGVAANNIVNQNTAGFTASQVRTTSVVTAGARLGGVQAQLVDAGGVEVATEFTRLILAETAYKATAAILRVAEDMARTSIDIVA